MKTISLRRLFLLALLAPLFTLNTFADDPVEIDGIYYTLVPKGKVATVTKKEVQKQNELGETYTERYSSSIVIPPSITVSGTTYSVVGIEDNAFSNSNVTSVSIPNSVTTIGQYAFSGCYNLTSVTIPSSVTSIPQYCFSGCSSLTSVTIPESITNIGYWAFWRCSSLTSVIIPNSITSIPSGCFSSCSNLTSVTIPNSVISIGGYAFNSCYKLASINLPISLVDIGDYAFALGDSHEGTGGTGGLTSITIPSSVMRIGAGIFYNCGRLNSVSLPEALDRIPTDAFSGCRNLSSISIPEKVNVIGDGAFSGCIRLTSIYIPGRIGRIGGRAFYDCSSLRSVKIEGDFLIGLMFALDEYGGSYGNRNVGSKAFAECPNLEEFTIASSYRWVDDAEVGGFIKTTEETTPYIESDAFNNSFVEYATLHVSESAIGLYKADAIWSQFGTITALGSASKYYKLFVDVNAKGKVVYGEGEFAKTIAGGSQTFDVKEKEDIVLTLTANEGYKLGKVIVNGVDKTDAVTSEGKLTITDVNGDQTVNVEFVYAGSSVSVTIGELGTATFCCDEHLDFSGTEDVKAYIASAFNPTTGQVTLTRITDVPAGTGIVLLGDEGTYRIPLGTGSTYVVNMLVGVDADKVLNKTEGSNSNFILSDGEKGVGFYAVSSGTTLAAGKAYLSLPTAALPTNAQSIGLRFGDATGIASPQPSEGKGDWFDLSGRRIDGVPAAPGLYIKNGKKVLIK